MSGVADRDLDDLGRDRTDSPRRDGDAVPADATAASVPAPRTAGPLPDLVLAGLSGGLLVLAFPGFMTSARAHRSLNAIPNSSVTRGGLTRRMPRKSWLVLLVALLGILVDGSALSFNHDPECARWRKAFLDMPTRTLVLEAAESRSVRIPVKLAATDEARRAGFQCATDEEIPTTLILFDFGAEVLRGFHMWNVPASLDIAFARESGRIFSILRMEPGTREVYGPMGWFRYALEARAGFFKEQGISIGHSMRLETAS